jgi:hypothetical protein
MLYDQVVTDEPVSLGGADTAATPLQTALVALMGCEQATIVYLAKKMGVTIDNVQFDLTAEYGTSCISAALCPAVTQLLFVCMLQMHVASSASQACRLAFRRCAAQRWSPPVPRPNSSSSWSLRSTLFCIHSLRSSDSCDAFRCYVLRAGVRDLSCGQSVCGRRSEDGSEVDQSLKLSVHFRPNLLLLHFSNPFLFLLLLHQKIIFAPHLTLVLSLVLLQR